MSDYRFQNFKDDAKKRTKYLLYHMRTNGHYSNHMGPSGQRYLIKLNSFADSQNSLIDIFLHFFTCIHQHDPTKGLKVDPKELHFNLLFVYMIDAFHTHDKYINLDRKNTEESLKYMGEIKGQRTFAYISEQDLKDQISSQYEKSKQRIKKQFENLVEVRSDFKRVKILKENLMKKYLDLILAIPIDQPRRLYYIPNDMKGFEVIYLKKLLKTLMDIQYTRMNYHRSKITAFLTNYERLWNTKGQKIIQQGRYKQYITIKRYTVTDNKSSTVINEVLMNLHNLVDIRRKDKSYFDEDILILRELGRLLVEHKTSALSSYPFLHPKYVIFNQLSLKVNLSYQSPLLQALGLQKQPTTIEQSATLAMTPQLYDQFSAPIEHLQRDEEDTSSFGYPQQIFYDSVYGADTIIQRYNKDPKDKCILRQIKNKCMYDIKMERLAVSEAWRFVMLSSYLLNQKEYYKHFIGQVNNYNNFKAYLKNQKDQYWKIGAKKYVSSVIGPKFTQYLEKQKIQLPQQEDKQLSLSIFDKFFGEKQDESYVSGTFAFLKMNLFLVWKNRLKTQIVNQINTKNKQIKSASATRYLALLYFCLYESALHIHLVCQFFINDFAKGKKLFNEMEDKIMTKELNEEKESYLIQAFSKLSYYESRSEGKYKEQIKYLLKNYQNAYKDFKINCDALKKITEEFKAIMSTKEEDLLKSSIQTMLQESYEMVKRFQKIALEIVSRQFSFPVEVSAEDDKQKILSMYVNLVKMKLFLLLTNHNFPNLESLIAPILQLVVPLNDEKRKGEAEIISLLQYALQILKQQQAKREEGIQMRSNG